MSSGCHPGLEESFGAPIVPLDPPSCQRLVLVGNPNVGKSLLFSSLTGKYVTVSNYPGTTVELTRARGLVDGVEREIIDTPGTNSLTPNSEDERVTRDILLSFDADVLQVGDFKNLRRTLLLTTQLAEFEIPITLCLNMSDEARDFGYVVDTAALSALLSVPVVATSALRRWNLGKLREIAGSPTVSSVSIGYALPIEHGVSRISALLPDSVRGPRGLALAILAGDATLSGFLEENVGAEVRREMESIREDVQASVPEDLAYTINRTRLHEVDELVEKVFSRPEIKATGLRGKLGLLSMHPVWGVPILLGVLWFAWWFVGVIGAGVMVDFFENVIFNSLINPLTIRFFDVIAPFPHTHLMEEGIISATYTTPGVSGVVETLAKFAHDLFVGPYGVVTMALTYAVAIVLPIVATFFVFFGALEDSGYLPRLAVMLNRVFRRMGLNGKAVLPMVLGLGCDTMATLSTRVLETKKEATIVILLLALGVPCSAQLGVIVAMLGPLGLGATVLWLSVIVGTIFLVGWLAAKLVRGESSDFVMELPPIRVPKMSNILIKVAARTEWYLKEAVPLFVVGTLVLYLTDLFGMLVYLQAAVSPLVVGLLGLPEEAANAFLIGFLRRDYGAAGLFLLQRDGLLDPVQTVVSLTVITLFIPCIANFLMIIRERGVRTAMLMTVFIITYSFGIGWAMNTLLRAFAIDLGG